MRAPKQEATGTAGLSDVMGNFERIGWGPVPNTLHDLGTDLFILARDARRFERGLLVGAQVKAGPTAFDRPVTDESGAVVGWEYYEADASHFDDWVKHGLPHLVVLNDLGSRISYWVHVTADAVSSTGKGVKILVPADQTVDVEHLEALMEVAANQRVPIPLEGTAWSAGVRNIAPSRRLRHAMIAPRLVAPHPNTGTSREIEPEEGLAILARGSVSRFEGFGEQHASVPKLNEANDHKDWRWRFAAALARYVLGNESAVGGLIDSAPNAAAQVAARVLQACELHDGEEYDHAIKVLTEQIEADNANPTDQAWLLMQRARIRADTGAVADARNDAVAAQVMLVGDEDDLTASALRGASGWLLFQTAPWADRKLQQMIESTDTAVSWWRTQATSSALSEAETRVFRRWADEQTRRFEVEDVVNNRLYAALLGAHLAGEQAAWRATGSVLARNTIMVAHGRQDHRLLQSGVDELRRSGDAPNTILAAQRLWSIGPLLPLRDAVAAIRRNSWTHTTALANIRLWEHGGDLLLREDALDASHFCLEVLSDPEPFAQRTNPTFRVVPALLDSLAGVVLAGGHDAQRDVLRFIAELPQISEDSEAQGWARVLTRLDPHNLDASERSEVRAAADRQTSELLSAQMLGFLIDDPDVLRVLLERARKGDSYALAAISDVNRLNRDAAVAVIEREATTLQRMVNDAEKGSYSVFVHDPVRTFVVVAAAFPEAAQWEALMGLLEHPQVAGEHKRSGCLALGNLVDELPQAVRQELTRILPAIGQTSTIDVMYGRPLAGADRYLGAALGSVDQVEFANILGKLMNGSRHDRMDAARLIMLQPDTPHVSALIMMLGDPFADVRAAGAAALAKLAVREPTRADPLVQAGLQQALLDPGARVPLGVAVGLGGPTVDRAEAVAVASQFVDHPSALVRNNVLQMVVQA